jgi:hypothetical protein
MNALQKGSVCKPVRIGHAMAQAVSRRPLTAEARVSPCGICGGQNGTGTGLSPSTSVFPCQFHSTGAPWLGKTKRPLGCGASVASAAGPFTKKKKKTRPHASSAKLLEDIRKTSAECSHQSLEDCESFLHTGLNLVLIWSSTWSLSLFSNNVKNF